MEETLLSGISFILSVAQRCDGSYSEQLKATLKSGQRDSCNDVTKDSSRNSKFGASLKKEIITFLTQNLYSYEILTDPRCNVHD